MTCRRCKVPHADTELHTGTWPGHRAMPPISEAFTARALARGHGVCQVCQLPGATVGAYAIAPWAPGRPVGGANVWAAHEDCRDRRHAEMVARSRPSMVSSPFL